MEGGRCSADGEVAGCLGFFRLLPPLATANDLEVCLSLVLRRSDGVNHFSHSVENDDDDADYDSEAMLAGIGGSKLGEIRLPSPSSIANASREHCGCHSR